MFIFLAFPRYFTQSELTKYWLQQLRKNANNTPSTNKYIYVALYLLAFITGVIPFFVPVQTVWQGILLYLPSLILTSVINLRVVRFAKLLDMSGRNAVEWHKIVVTGLNAHQIVLSKWFSIVKFFRVDFV